MGPPRRDFGPSCAEVSSPFRVPGITSDHRRRPPKTDGHRSHPWQGGLCLSPPGPLLGSHRNPEKEAWTATEGQAQGTYRRLADVIPFIPFIPVKKSFETGMQGMKGITAKA